MSKSRYSQRINGKRRFLITGFSQEEKDRLALQIKQLGGEYINDRVFKEQCTHVVSDKPNRSEKFLGACASGKWIVRKAYLDACQKAGEWVDELEFEWTDDNIGDVRHPFLYRAPRRWREYVKSTERLAFDGWRVILIVDDSNLRSVFRRLLEVGGAAAVIQRLPPVVDKNITHIFVKTSSLSYSYLKPWKEKGIPCLATDYIGDYLVEDEVPPFCSRDIFLRPGSETVSEEQKIKNDNLSQHSNSDSGGSKTRLLSDSGNLSSRSSSICGTPAKAEPVLPLKKLAVSLKPLDLIGGSGNRSEDKRGSARNESDMKISDENNNAGPVKRSVRLCEKRQRKRKDKEKESAAICGNSPSESEKKTCDDVKDKALHVEINDEIRETRPDDSIVKESESPRGLKRKDAPNSYPIVVKRPRRYEDVVMTSDQHCFLRHQPPTSLSLPMPLHMMEMFNTCYEEDRYEQALDIFLRYISSEKYPTHEMIGKVIKMLLTSTETRFAESVYVGLKRLLALHPPSSPSLQVCYLNALQIGGSAWEFITCLIDVSKGENIDMESPNLIQNNLLVLGFLNDVFRVNILYVEAKLREERMMPILAQILWNSNELGQTNNRMRHLIRLAADATVRNDNPKLTQVLYSLVLSAFSCVQSCFKDRALNRANTEAFIVEITRLLLPLTSDMTVLKRLFEYIGGTRLCLGICSSILNSLDNVVPVDKYKNLNLGKIFGYYLFCIPKRVPVKPTQITPGSPKKGRTQLSKSVLTNVNKRNGKGETKLHIACIKGDATLVRQLLTIPGIDVNMKDYAGWTPLHEACNLGHVECVQLLLDYKPPKTIDSYFSPVKVDKVKARTVDLMATDPEGTTPLHDAVMNHRVEVVRLLVKYGDETLLRQRTTQGMTPCDLAQSPEMVEALNNAGEEDGSSQIDCSQLSTLSEDLSQMYAESESDSCVSAVDCKRFLMIFESLLFSYIRVRDMGSDRMPDGEEMDENWKYLKRMPKYVRKLEKHINRICVEESRLDNEFSDAFERFQILAESYC